MIRLLFILLTTSVTFSLSAQDEKLVIEGAIVIQDNDDPNPVAGTIRWTGIDFEGYDGTNWISLTCCDSGLPIDCDGNIYQTVQIGTQTWFAENLKATCYSDGTSIPFASTPDEWQSLTAIGPVAAFPNFDQSLVSTHGIMYNGKTIHASNGLNVCPSGYHVFTNNERIILTNFLGPTSGGELKTIGTIQAMTGNWETPNTGATNSAGFNGDPSYIINNSGVSILDPTKAQWWYGADNSINDIFFLLNNSSSQGNGGVPITRGYPIRCVKD